MGSDRTARCCRVSCALEASVEDVWRALTEPTTVRQWLGDLSEPFVSGELLTLDRGDGDFSILETLRVEPATCLEYVSRSFGIGPGSTVTWALQARGDGCLLTVTDIGSEPDARPIREAWLRRMARLESVLRGQPPGSSFEIADVHLSTELPGQVEDIWRAIGEFPFSDAQEFEVSDVVHDNEAYTLGFQLSQPDWLAPTQWRLRVTPLPRSGLVDLRHVGWQAISFSTDVRQQQRKRFAGWWYRALLQLTLRYVRRFDIGTLTPSEVDARRAQPGVVVLDSNRVTLWNRGHVPGAIFAGQEDIPAHALPVEQDSTLVFYCRDTM